mmetsp:Transcript_4657/g.8213  ORF Transcript_4657/g.8213 Transcript_4657/m.8213 type:complete len:309 (-) Transcript_4657:944-1870(-)
MTRSRGICTHGGHVGLHELGGNALTRELLRGGRLDIAKARVLKKMGAKVVSGVQVCARISAADKAATHDHIVLAVKAWCAKVVIVRVHFKAVQWVELVLGPLPGVAAHIVHVVRVWSVKVYGGLRAVGQVQVAPAFRRHGGATVGERGVVGGIHYRVTLVLFAEQHVLCLRDQTESTLAKPLAGSFPLAKGGRLMLVHVYGPAPRHVHLLEHGAQPVLVLTSGPGLFPESGPLGVAKRAPSPAVLGPVVALPIASVPDKFVKLAVRDHHLRGFKVRDLEGTHAVLVIPSVGHLLAVFANAHGASVDRY